MDYSSLTTKFDRVSDLFKQEWTRHESVPGESTASVDRMFVHHFDRYIESNEVIAEAENMGARVATVEELISYAEKYPDEQRKYWIVGLGSSTMFDDDRYVPILSEDGARRGLDDDWFDGGWDARYRFLLVRKENLDTGKLDTSELGELDTWTEDYKDGFAEGWQAALSSYPEEDKEEVFWDKVFLGLKFVDMKGRAMFADIALEERRKRFKK